MFISKKSLSFKRPGVRANVMPGVSIAEKQKKQAVEKKEEKPAVERKKQPKAKETNNEKENEE